MKIYTRTGDKGQTSLFGGERVSKTHGRVMAYGAIDELNSYLGLALASARAGGALPDSDEEWILQTQRDLFALGSWLASPEASARVARGEEAFSGARQARTHVDAARITAMEETIDQWENGLAPMKTFILPGGSLAGAHLHFARTLCRRAERDAILLQESGETVPPLVVQYLNRLADGLFVLARRWNAAAGVMEDPWS